MNKKTQQLTRKYILYSCGYAINAAQSSIFLSVATFIKLSVDKAIKRYTCDGISANCRLKSKRKMLGN